VSFGAVLVGFGAMLMCLRRVFLGFLVVARFMVYGVQVMTLGGLRVMVSRSQVVLGRMMFYSRHNDLPMLIRRI
jgi:hypothetical protein